MVQEVNGFVLNPPILSDGAFIRNLVNRYNHVEMFKFRRAQLTTAAYVEVAQLGGLTITIPSSKIVALFLWQEADTAADYLATVTIEYLTEGNVVTTVTGVIVDGTDSTTEVNCGIADMIRIRKMTGSKLFGKYIAVGATGKATIYGVIEEGNYQSLHSRYRAPANRRSFIHQIKGFFPDTTNLASILIVYYPKGSSLAQQIEYATVGAWANWTESILDIELEPGTDVTFSVKRNADTDHANIVLDYEIVEAYN